MPHIPRIDAPQVSVGAMPTPYWNPDASRGTHGEGIAEGARSLARGFQSLGEGLQMVEDAEQKAKSDHDAAAVEKALADFGDATNQATLAHRELKGQNALAGMQPLRDDLQGQRATIMDGLANDEQKEIFAQRSGLLLHHTYRDMETHQSQQISELQDQSYAAFEKTTFDSLKIHANDPDAFAPHGTVQSTIDTYLGTNLTKELNRKGIAAEAREELTAQWKRKAYGTVLQAMVAPPDGSLPNAQRARDFFQAHSADLGPDLGEHYSKIVRELGLKQQAEDAVSQLTKQHSRNALLPNGSTIQHLDGPAINDAIERMNLPAEEKERIRQIGDQVAAHAERQWGKVKQDVYNSALADYIKTGSLAGINPATTAWMLDPRNDAVSQYETLRRIAKADQEHAYQIRGKLDDTPEQIGKLFTLENLLSKMKEDDPLGYMKLTDGDLRGMAASAGLGAKGSVSLLRTWHENYASASKADPTKPLPKETTDYVLSELRRAYGLPEQKSAGFDPMRFETWENRTTPAGIPAASAALQLMNDLRAWRAAHPKATPEELEAQTRTLLAEKVKVTREAPWYRRLVGTKTVEEEVPGYEARSGKIAPAGGTPAKPLAQPTESPRREQGAPTGLIPPGIPMSFVREVQAKAGGRSISPSDWDKLWEKNKAKWGKR